IDHGNIERSEIDDDREALIDQPARQRAVKHRGVDPAGLERLADQHRVADHQYTDIVPFDVEPDMFEPEDCVHPGGAAHALNTEAFAAQLLSGFQVRTR